MKIKSNVLLFAVISLILVVGGGWMAWENLFKPLPIETEVLPLIVPTLESTATPIVPIATPLPKPTATVTPTATELPEKTYTVSAGALRQTMRWSYLVEKWLPNFDTLNAPLVLSVIMKESLGNPYALDGTGLGDSVGVMQVIPRTWIPCYEELTGPYKEDAVSCQIYAGMWMLHSIIKNKGGGDVRYSLAAYNCGFESVDAGKCYPWGGYVYADVVLNEILPVVLEEYERIRPE